MSFYHLPGVEEDENQPPEAMERSRVASAGDGHHMATGEPSVQERSPDESDRKTKTRRRSRRKKRAAKGYGDKAGSHDRDGEDSRRGSFDGLRYPQPVKVPKRFPCPFYECHPTQYHECSSIRLRRVGDVSQHIGRRHMLRDVLIHDSTESRPSITPDEICVYCTWCRQEFHGPGADTRLHDHTTACEARKQPATIEDTGVLVPKELDDLRSALATVMGNTAKWNVIWNKCFPGTTPPPPYAGMAVSRTEAQRILQQLLASSAANPWSSVEIRQSWIDKALSAIYSGSPFSDTEPQVNNTSPIPSSISDYEESTFDDLDDGSSTVSESCVDLCDMDQWTRPLKSAIQDVDHDRVHGILRNSFDKVAVGEYSWLLELKALDLSTDEIANELLERSQHGPWIYHKINMPDLGTYHHEFHIPECLHSSKDDEVVQKLSSQASQVRMSLEDGSENSVRETIEYLCGIGGVSPMPDGSPRLQFGSVVFENAKSRAIVSLMSDESFRAIPDVLQGLEKAIGALQQVGGCCDSFTFLARQESLVELKRTDPQKTSFLESLTSRVNSEASLADLGQQLLSSLTAQFLSLAFSLYAQGHCEPFRPFFLDTSLKRILLIGNQVWGPCFNGPCILASAVELSCFGEMVQRRVFAFQYFEAFERSKVFSDSDTKFDLKACPEDLLDTWGPGQFIMPKDDPENIHAISIGGGLITATLAETESHQLPNLHWSPASEYNSSSSLTFPRHEKMIIGSKVSINQACKVTPKKQVQMAIPWLKELGTFPSYWEVSERQLGLGIQAGKGAVVTTNFAQTWVKRLGQTKKSNILAKRSLSMADLEGPFAVQVSFCTGIARRVQLRELLADVLPVYVADLATLPRNWNRLQSCNICQTLRDNDFRIRYQKLDRELQAEFETLAIAVLFLLQDTGVDRKGENFVVGCMPPGSAIQCFKIPIEKESFWTRILADSEDVASFAYVATNCLETDLVRCRGPKEQWKNTTALFSTAVSLCQDRVVTQEIVAQQTSWTLKNSEAYLIGRVDAPLLVRVMRPNIQDEPELLVSMSTIIAPFLRRWSRKQGYKRPWRLRESRGIDHQHQMAENVVVTTNLESL